MKHLWLIGLLVLIGPCARADQIVDVKGTTNYVLCAAEDRHCPAVLLNLVFDTTPNVLEIPWGFENVVNSFGGTINGMNVTGGAGGWLQAIRPGGCPLASNATCGTPFPTVLNFAAADGTHGELYWDDLVIGGMVLSSPDVSSLLLWSANVVPPVSTPEPSTGMLLAAAIPIGLLLRKR